MEYFNNAFYGMILNNQNDFKKKRKLKKIIRKEFKNFKKESIYKNTTLDYGFSSELVNLDILESSNLTKVNMIDIYATKVMKRNRNFEEYYWREDVEKLISNLEKALNCYRFEICI